MYILGTVKEEVTVPPVPHSPSSILKSIVHSTSFKSKCHIDEGIVEMIWKLGSKSLLQVLLKSHPNSPQVETYTTSQVHAEVDHAKAMFQEVRLQNLWKSDALSKLSIGKLGPSQVKCTLQVSPSKDKSSEVHPEPRAASSDHQEVSVWSGLLHRPGCRWSALAECRSVEEVKLVDHQTSRGTRQEVGPASGYLEVGHS